jgi:hypothetical protein
MGEINTPEFDARIIFSSGNMITSEGISGWRKRAIENKILNYLCIDIDVQILLKNGAL